MTTNTKIYKKIVTSNGSTKHNKKEKQNQKNKKAQMKCSIAMLMDERNTLSPKPKDYSGFGIL
jgi:hypothetical protein